MNKFEILKRIGKGSFASVFQVLRKDDNQLYALKRVNIPNMSSSDKEHALNEIRILASFTHPNIISFQESFYSEDSKTLDIIMEYAEGGDISSLISKSKANHTTISERTIWIYLIHMLFGLRALHEKKVIHRDLKSANVFICKDNTAKIGDFNVAKRLKYSTYMQSQTGTPYYASPEIWLEKPYDMRTDIWSLGCIVYEMCTLQVPFQAHSIPFLCKAVTKGEYKPIPFSYSKTLEIILSELLVTDMNNRKTCDELLRHHIIIKKMEMLGIRDMQGCGMNNNLLDTIKFPKNQEDLNLVLPKAKKYSSQTELGSVVQQKEKQEQEMQQQKMVKGRAQSTKIMGRILELQNQINNRFNIDYSEKDLEQYQHQDRLDQRADIDIEERKKDNTIVSRNQRESAVKVSYCVYDTKYNKPTSRNGINTAITKRLNSVLMERRLLNNQKYDKARDYYLYPSMKKIYHI